MKILFLIISIYMYAFSANSQAVLIEEKGQFVSRSQSRVNYLDGYDFKNKRRVGVGLGVAGVHGLLGAQLELNFTPEIAVTASAGTSDSFQNFGFQVKRSFPGKYFSPYLAGGFTRWHSGSRNEPITTSNPSFLADKFLSEEERSSGQFTETFIYPSMGMQYIQLDGDWAGSSIYAEVTLLLDSDNLKSAPTGSLGYLYYF